MNKVDSSDLFTLCLYEKWVKFFLKNLRKEEFINADALKVRFYEYLKCQYDILKTRSKKSDREELGWLFTFKNEEPDYWPSIKRYKYSIIDAESSDCDSDVTDVN